MVLLVDKKQRKMHTVDVDAAEQMPRPSLAFQHAFDWLAVCLHHHRDRTGFFTCSLLAATELMNRRPETVFLEQGCSYEERKDGYSESLKEIGQFPAESLAALGLVIPSTALELCLEQARSALRPSSSVHLVTNGPLARFLPDSHWFLGASRDFSSSYIRRVARDAGYRITEELGIHGIPSVAWHYAAVVAETVGRTDWKDRFHVRMRERFVTQRVVIQPTALLCITLQPL